MSRQPVTSRHFRSWACVIALAALTLAGSSPARAEAPCLPPAAPPQRIEVEGFYADPKASTIDAEKWKRRSAAMEPFRVFLQRIVDDADRSLRGDAAAARCARSWLVAWAAARAWVGPLPNAQAEYERKWDLAGYALAWLKVRDGAAEAERQVIEPWLALLARQSLAFFDDRRNHRNNHWYWTGLAVGATALGTGDDELWAAARAIMADAARDISADGTLPRERARGSRALHYHGFSVMPVVILAELGAVRGEDWYALGDGAVHRLAAVTLRGFAEPELFALLTGAPVAPKAEPGSGWYQLYVRRFPGRAPAAPRRIDPGHRWIGGDALLLGDVLARMALAQRPQ